MPPMPPMTPLHKSGTQPCTRCHPLRRLHERYADLLSTREVFIGSKVPKVRRCCRGRRFIGLQHAFMENLHASWHIITFRRLLVHAASLESKNPRTQYTTSMMMKQHEAHERNPWLPTFPRLLLDSRDGLLRPRFGFEIRRPPSPDSVPGTLPNVSKRRSSDSVLVNHTWFDGFRRQPGREYSKYVLLPDAENSPSCPSGSLTRRNPSGSHL